MIWLEDRNGVPAPTFWQQGDEGDNGEDVDRAETLELRKRKIEEFADNITITNPESIRCDNHESEEMRPEDCDDCKACFEMVAKFQTHSHSFSCNKKNKFMRVQPDEGHGKNDKRMYGPDLKNIPVCRHNFPKYPMEKTMFLIAPPKDLDENEVIKRKADLKKIKKYLTRQTYTETRLEELETWKKMKTMSFLEFLQEVGMFQEERQLSNYSSMEIEKAIDRYYNALAMSMKGTGAIFLKRKVSDIFTNAFNPPMLKLTMANHDVQVVVDQFAVAQYICGYLTKNESGISKLLRTINEEYQGKNLDKIKQIGSALDKGREVSVQEAVYRLRGDPMTKSSEKVKTISTAHPHFREGLLKANLEALEEGDKIFHTSKHEYYENRPLDSNDPSDSDDDINYWENLCCADFIANYEIVYGKDRLNNPETLIKLENDKGYIRRRNSVACLRYYLHYDNDEDLARGLLILFLPFRNEMKDIHDRNVFQLLEENRDVIDSNREKYEKYKLMTDLINEIQKKDEKDDESENDDDEEIETTNPEDIQDFENWAAKEASKELAKLADMTDIPNVIDLRKNISSLNNQQRRCFDDFCERVSSCDVDEPPFYLWISGSAGTGKSTVLKSMIQAVKYLRLNPNEELRKPTVIVGAPTANAAYIVNGKTIDSIFGFNPTDGNRYVPCDPGHLSTMKFNYEDVRVFVIDEISMVGSSKLTKINYRLQEMADAGDKTKFMGGRSMVVSGDVFQLQPIYDGIVLDNSGLDGRIEHAPSHFRENFKIFFLEEKMRSAEDAEFSHLCDRVARGEITQADEDFLKSRVKDTPNEQDNEKFKLGKLSIIVTTNKKREAINQEKLEALLPSEKEYSCNSVDRVTNVPLQAKLSEGERSNLGKTGNLPTTLKLKVNAPVVMTSNHKKRKYKEDGLVNGARGYVSAVQTDVENPDVVKAVWVVFNDETIGRRYRSENYNLRQGFDPGHTLAVPILPERRTFQTGRGGVKYQRTNFPLSLAYAITCHKCQGLTLDEVIIDFGEDKEKKIRTFLQFGSFYVALTRVRNGSKVFLKSFDRSFIVENKSIRAKLEAFKQFNSYKTKKVYIEEEIFENPENEIKIGYLNCNGLMQANHAQYINCDRNLKKLDLLALAESKLTSGFKDEEISDLLTDWRIVKRFDAADGKQHMGLVLLVPKEKFNQIAPYIYSVAELNLNKNNMLQIQGLRVKFQKEDGMDLGLIYCREKPTVKECEAIKRKFDACHIILGDLNLSTRNEEDKKKLDLICGPNKILALKEITRLASSNQLDHIMIERYLTDNCYATSYLNFISDHKSIVVRLNFTSGFLQQFLQRLHFDEERHLKHSSGGNNHDKSEDTREAVIQDTEQIPASSGAKKMKVTKPQDKEVKNSRSTNQVNKSFNRRFKNPDATCCWLNSCLQLFLNAFDHYPHIPQLQSPLGVELLRLLKTSQMETSPILIRDIVMEKERERIRDEPGSQLIALDDTNQQCVRDFLIALTMNHVHWSDLFMVFCFQMVEETICGNQACKHTNTTEQDPRMYLELEVPPDGSQLNHFVEEALSQSYPVENYHCERQVCVSFFCISDLNFDFFIFQYGGCGKRTTAKHSTKIKSLLDKHHLIVLLRRVMQGPDGVEINMGRVSSTGKVKVISKNGEVANFMPTAVIQHSGQVIRGGDSRGHYTCDVLSRENDWWHTNDKQQPKKINRQKVSKHATTVLYKRIT